VSGETGKIHLIGGDRGAGRSGGIEKTSLISLTSEERRARPHMEGSNLKDFATRVWSSV
jgi:hypothetical protein